MRYHAGVGYKTKIWNVNVIFGDNAPPPPQITKEETEANIIGVVLINRYNMKKSINLFYNRVEGAVMMEF